jgi:hypothetical protein
LFGEAELVVTGTLDAAVTADSTVVVAKEAAVAGISGGVTPV